MDHLTRDVLAAERAGMSYGNWKVLHPMTAADDEEFVRDMVDLTSEKRICEVCGKEFIPTQPKMKYCSYECRFSMKKEYNDKYREKHANRGVFVEG